MAPPSSVVTGSGPTRGPGPSTARRQTRQDARDSIRKDELLRILGSICCFLATGTLHCTSPAVALTTKGSVVAPEECAMGTRPVIRFPALSGPDIYLMVESGNHGNGGRDGEVLRAVPHGGASMARGPVRPGRDDRLKDEFFCISLPPG